MPIYLAFVLTLFNMMSQSATRVIVVLFALKLGAQPLTIGILAATFALFPMMLAWQAGKALDRFGPRWLLILGAAAGACGLLLSYFMHSLPALFVTAALSGLSMTFYNLSLQNLVGMLSTAGNRARNFSNFAIVIAVANAIGPLGAGFLIDRAGHAFTFLCVAGLLVVPVALLLIRGGVLPGSRRDRGPAHSIRRTLTNPQLWPVLAASSIAQSGLDLFQIYLPVYGVARGLSASQIGVIIAMSAAGGFMARLLLTRLIAWFGEEKVISYALFLGALSFTAVPFFTSAAALSIVAFVFGFGLNSTQPTILILLFIRATEGQSGAVLGLRVTLDNAARLAAPVLFGLVASALGVGAVFWINALVLGTGGSIARAAANKRKRPTS